MKTALVIEDNENNMELITFILENAGYDTVRADTGESGFELSHNADIDFVILDIQLPGIDGPEVLQKIREYPSTQKLPVIAMTSYAMSGDRERLLAAGCNGYIEKPINPEKVIAQIETILHKT